MKKLLSLLSVLTISGTTAPTTIAASPYQNDKIKLEKSKINYLQTNNIEILNRNKRYINDDSFLSKDGYFDFYWMDEYEFNDKYSKNYKVTINNKIYFTDRGNNGQIILKEEDVFSGKLFIISNNINNEINSTINRFSLASLKNELYFNSEKGIYKYDKKEKQIVLVYNYEITSNISILNEEFYFSSKNKICKYNIFTKKLEIIKNIDGIINRIITNNNNVIFQNNNKNICLFLSFNPKKTEPDIINLEEQVKRGLYLQYKKENPNSKIEKIYNINLQNLTALDVIIKSEQKNKPINLEDEFNICPDSNSTFINKSDSEQTQNTTSCSKQVTETNTIQKMNGFSKSDSTANNDNWTAKWGGKFTFKASGSAGIPLVTEGKVEAGFEVSHETSWGKSRTETITDTSTSSDTEIKTTTNTTTVTVPSQPVKIPPRSKISISTTTWKNNIDFILNTYQKVNGMVNAEFIDKNNESKIIYISIKDAMLILLENHILPSKIKINDDDSINFCYDIKIKREIIMHQTEIGKAIPLNLDEQNSKN